jgi:hypothetical protein
VFEAMFRHISVTRAAAQIDLTRLRTRIPIALLREFG